MGLPEPSGPLWTEVKGIYDPWPPDDEQVALDLGVAWQQAATTAHTAAERSVTAGGNAYAAWQDGAGRLLDAHTRAYGEQVALLEQGMLMHGGAAQRYGEQVRSVKETIESVISTYQPFYDLLSNPGFGDAGRAMRDWLVQNVADRLRDMVLGAASQVVQTANELGLQFSASGPDADFEEKFAEGGKFAETKAWAELFKLGVRNADGTFKGEAKLGAEVSRSHSLTNEGLKAQLEAVAGLTIKGEYKDAVGPNGLVGYGAEAEALAGGKAGAGLMLGPQGFEAKAEAFVGGRIGGKVFGDVGGIGLGFTAEGWAGPGAEAGVTAKNENGVWTLGASAGASPVLGGKLGVELRVDSNKVVETAGHVALAVQDGVAAVGQGYETVRQGVEDVGRDVGEGVEAARRGVEDFGNDVGRGIQDAGDRVHKFFNPGS